MKRDECPLSKKCTAGADACASCVAYYPPTRRDGKGERLEVRDVKAAPVVRQDSVGRLG